MAKVIPSPSIASISDKLSKRGKVYTRTSKRTGKVSLVTVGNPYNGPWSEAQKKHRDDFKFLSKTASQWLKEHDPKRNGGILTDEYKAMLRKYEAQHKIGNIFAFIAKHYKDGQIQSFLP